MDEWRRRLAVELGRPSSHIVLVGEEKVKPHVVLDTVSTAKGSPLTVLIQPAALNQEHCVEAACALLDAACEEMRKHQTGRSLMQDTIAALESEKAALSKRCQFIVMDLLDKVTSLESSKNTSPKYVQYTVMDLTGS